MPEAVGRKALEPGPARERSSHLPQVTYGIDDRPPFREAVPLGLQHLFAMLLSNVTIPLIIAGALGLPPDRIAVLIQAVLLMAGLATIVQSYPVGPVGARLPIVMGTSVAYIGASISIGRDFGLATVFGACVVAALVEIVLGFSIGKLHHLFPPLVNGIVVMLIGLTLIPVGVDYAAGGVGAADYGAPVNLLVAGTVFVTILVLNQFGRGMLSHAAVLWGVGLGWALAGGLGMVDVSPVGAASWLQLPAPLAFGFEVRWSAVLVMSFIYVVSTMETIGDISGTVAAEGREPTPAELRGGLVADGVMSALAGVFSAFPNTSYSQNVGLVNLTGVVSRHVTAVTGVLLVVLGLLPKVAALFATIPAPVVGGVGLVVFGMIFSSGAAIVQRAVPMTRRNLVILAVALTLGLGVEFRPQVVQAVPEGLRTLAGSGLILGGLAALLLNVVLPRRHLT